MRKSAFCLLILALLLAVMPAWAQAPVAPPASATTTEAGPAPVKVEGQFSNANPVFGERIELRVTLRYPSGYRVFFPTKPDLRPLLVDTRDPGKTERREAGGQVTETIVIPALAVRAGAMKTPAIEVPWHAAGDQGASGTVTLPPVRAVVKSQFAGDTQVDPAALPPPRPLVEENVPLEVGLLIALMMAVSAVVTYLGLKVYRDRAARRAPKPRVPAHITALQRLDDLEHSGRLETTEPNLAFAELSEILRQYLGGRYRVAALDMTSTELLRHFAKVDLRGVQQDELRAFAELSDLVKFARLPASSDELRRESAFVRKVVERTMLTAAEQEALRKAEIDRLARQRRLRLQVMAPGPLRLRAFAIDVFVGALATALLAWVAIDTGKQLLFDISYAILPIWLIIRDALAAQSPGKTLIGLQIAEHEDESSGSGDDPWLGLVAHDDESPSARQASTGARLLRNLLLALPLAGVIAEAVTCLYLPEMRRIGDQWASTRVIDGRVGVRRGTPKWLPAMLILLLAGLVLALPLLMGGRPA